MKKSNIPSGKKRAQGRLLYRWNARSAHVFSCGFRTGIDQDCKFKFKCFTAAGGGAKCEGLARSEAQVKRLAPFEIRCAEVRLSPIRKTTTGRHRDRVKSSQDFTCAAPF